MCFLCSHFHQAPQYSAYKLLFKTEGEALQAESSVFLLSAPLKMVPKMIMEANPCQPFLTHNFTPCYGYSVKQHWRAQTWKMQATTYFIISEDIKSSLGCYPQNVRAKPTNWCCYNDVLEIIMDVSLLGFLSSLVLKWRIAALSILFVLLL